MYSQVFELQAELLKAMSQPRRLEIVHLLRDQELSVTDIHTMLDLPQANISQHLTILREAGVVLTRRQGKQIYYQLSHRNIIQASDLLRAVLIEHYQDTPLANELTLKMQDLVPLVQDPVCQMRLSPKTAGFHYRHEGQDYYFCASGCKSKFIQEPTQYV